MIKEHAIADLHPLLHDGLGLWIAYAVPGSDLALGKVVDAESDVLSSLEARVWLSLHEPAFEGAGVLVFYRHFEYRTCLRLGLGVGQRVGSRTLKGRSSVCARVA